MDTKLREAIRIVKEIVKDIDAQILIPRGINDKQSLRTLIDFAQRGIEVAGVMPQKGKIRIPDVVGWQNGFNEAIDLCTLAMTGKDTEKPKELEPYNRPPSNHLEVNYIAVGYYKHEIDFGVLGSVQELSDTNFNKMLDMLQTAIKVAKEMRERASAGKENKNGL